MEDRPITKANHFNFTENPHRPTLEDQRRTPNEIGLKVGQQGTAAPMVAHLRPNLVRAVHTASLWSILVGMAVN